MHDTPNHSDSHAVCNGASARNTHTAFSLLHRGVQRQLYRMQWSQLRPLQVDAIHCIIESHRDVILSAGTATGKTEAAFLPILSQIADEPHGAVRTLYVGPLKALINDQFRRVEDLCEHLEMPVHRWHGDVPANQKASLIKKPGGVLLITPESIESLFVNRSEHLRNLFGGLRFIVVDEVHSFLTNERGLQLRSLLSRIRGIAKSCNDNPSCIRSIGLSATIGDIAVAQAYLRPNSPDQVAVITDDSDKKELRLRIHGYLRPKISSSDDTQADDNTHLDMATDMVSHCHGHANLMFANAKADVEEFADLCRRIGESEHYVDQFLVHHGSLSSMIREDTEATMKSGRPATTFCSSTLEMGIDIGSVRMIGQIGPPWSVASLKQRLGRSGRRDGDPRILRIYTECSEPTADSTIFDRLHLELLQSVAIIQLMLEGWTEPDTPPSCDLSTLIQQIISVIAQHGGAPVNVVYDELCSKDSAFADIEPSLFTSVLRSLGDRDIVEQMDTGELILGIVGERICRSRGFYAVFQTAEEYSILHEGILLGTLELVPQPNDYLLFAGRRWQVNEIDYERMQVYVKPAKGWKRPRFTGGIGVVHPRVRAEMRQILRSDSTLLYLDNTAQLLLSDARSVAGQTGLNDRHLLPLGPNYTALMTWTGTVIQQTIAAMFEYMGFQCRDEHIGLVLPVDESSLRHAIQDAIALKVEPVILSRTIRPRFMRKYDQLLADGVLDKSISLGRVDLAGANQVLRKAATSG